MFGGITTKRIVLGLDNNQHSAHLVTWTAAFSSAPGLCVSIVHVVHRSEVWLLASLMIDSNKYLRSLREHFEHEAVEPLRAHDLAADVTIRLGDPARELAAVARTKHADVIVVGAASHPWAHHLMGRGVAERLERLVAIPVQVVPHVAAPVG
jgi:nucleotide-binding universal stress UspA family protein